MSRDTNLAIQDAIQLALGHHRAGRLPEAEHIYQRVLRIEPDNPHALHLLGVIAYQVGKHELSLQLIGQALQHRPSEPAFLNSLGEANRGLGRLQEALACYDRALSINPDNIEALGNRGNILQSLKRHAEALASYDRALAVKPDFAEALGNRGLALQELKRYDEALLSYDKALALKPDYAIALCNCGNVFQEFKRHDQALACYDRALTIQPDYVEALNNRGNSLRELKRYDEALASYARALTMRPGFGEGHNNLGMALNDLGRLQDAMHSFRRAVSLKPDFAVAHNNLGITLAGLGFLQEAEESFRRALALEPGNAYAHSNLGNALKDLGQPQRAEESYRRALALDPDYAMAHNNLGNVLRDLGRLQEAEASCRHALELDPGYAEAYCNLGNVFRDLGRPHETEEHYRRALVLKPDYAMAHNNLGNSLLDQGHFEESGRSFRQALALKPDFFDAHSNLIFAMDLAENHDLEAQQAERRRWFEQHGRRHAADIPPHENSPDPMRVLRVGYVSADFRRHSAYYIFSPVLYAHDRSAFEVFCYSGVRLEDDATARLKSAVQGWRSSVGVSDTALARQIREDRIDILVDLSGHSAGNRLPVFARKPAPVQVTAWGHAHGTGLETMDYFFVDPVFMGKKDRALFAEKVLDLPCVICYQAPEYAPEVQPLPALGAKPFTFGCINRIEKISDRSLGLWGRIMGELPESRLLLKDRKLGDARLREDFLRRLAAVGIGPERVVLLGGSSHVEHLKTYHEVDLGLDPFPHGGGVSTAEALWMGVPVVTLPGHTLPSRVSASVLTALGMKPWVARSDADYVRIAVKAARDLPRLARLRQGLRARIAGSEFGDARRYTAAVEKAYRSMWQLWCKQAKARAAG